jgi:hypothetical protein
MERSRSWEPFMRKSGLLVFLHLAKTGGTSLSNAVRRLFPPDRIFIDGSNNLTVEYVQALEGRLDDGGFIAGHAGLGVVSLLRERADITTMLRRPEDQLISHYLHTRSDPSAPLHQDANTLSFSQFIDRHPSYVINQSGSLYYSILEQDSEITDVIHDGIELIIELMESMLFIGVIERADESCAVLSRILNTEYPLHLPYFNATMAHDRISTSELESLHIQCRQLRLQPHLAPLFEIEDRVYAKACALLDRHSASAGAPAPRSSGNHAEIAEWEIPPQRFFSAVGRIDAGRFDCPLDAAGGCLIYGPYDRLNPGAYEVEYCFELLGVTPDRSSSIWIEVFVNGRQFLARRRLRGPGPFSRSARTLTFADRDGTGVLEFRIYGIGRAGGRLVFEGVRVRAAGGAVSRLSASLSRRLWIARGPQKQA